ncbi:MAG TPA: aldehyde dehydrogenase family protein [Actinomycetota bacterium]|jgi:acyl-CoA reductase-like NAD-dependent aldehyde dehydrogenase|nr:aldehyde dehydrogenase family protein [Actinomycetota bacterium]
MGKRDKVYIDGAWVAPSGKDTIDVLNATTEEVMGTIPQCTPEDVDKAVKAARKALDSWSATSVEDRAKFLQRIHEGLQARSDEIATTVSQENGMPLGISKIAQAMLPIMNMAGFSQVAAEYDFTEQVGTSDVIKEPVGVVACITPWNYPLHQVVLKVAPALAAGCTVVLKPSELAPLTAFILAEVVDDVGLPAGVFNLITGTGSEVGEPLVAHPEIDMISFTGSTRAGRRISEVAAPMVKRVALELGGKSPNVILDDADLEAAVTAGIAGCYLNSGQTCTALTRMLVPKAKLEQAEEIAKKVAETFTPGDPFDANTRLGPLVSAQQQERVRGYINKGIEEGAKLVTGGPEQPEGLEKGYFVKPTVFSNVSNDMTIAREEIFGPVLSIIPYEDEEDAVRIANDTIYGLMAAVFSGDAEHAKAVAKRIRAGQVQINSGGFNPNAPFGGYKQSGKGREAGKYGLEEFLEIKALLN